MSGEKTFVRRKPTAKELEREKRELEKLQLRRKKQEKKYLEKLKELEKKQREREERERQIREKKEKEERERLRLEQERKERERQERLRIERERKEREEKRKEEMRNDVLKSLNKKDFVYDTVDTSSIKEKNITTPQTKAEKDKPKVDILSLHRRLSELDPSEGEKTKGLIANIDAEPKNRLQSITHQLKVSIAKAEDDIDSDKWHRKELEYIRKSLSEKAPNADLSDEIDQILAGKELIDKKSFLRLVYQYEEILFPVDIDDEDTLNEEDEEPFAPQDETGMDFLSVVLVDRLKQKGYDIYDENGRKIQDVKKKAFFKLDLGPEYFVMDKTDDDGNVAFRIVRVVETEKDLDVTTDTQRLRDREAVKKFCAFCKNLSSELNDDDIGTDLREDRDEEEEILVIVNPELAKLSLRKEQKKTVDKLRSQESTIY
jgi:hypothetical protein